MSLDANESANDRALYLDVLRVVAILCVVTVHVSDSIVWASTWYVDDPSYWWAGNIYNAAAKIGVPLFVMVSGALLLHSKRADHPLRFLRRRFWRLLPAFIIWSAAYSLWTAYIYDDSFTISKSLQAFADGGTYYHLWFIYMISVLYLITPMLRPMIERGSRGLLIYAVALWSLWVIVLPAAQRTFGLEGSGIEIYSFIAYAGYFILGALLGTLCVRGWLSVWVALVTLGSLWFNAQSIEAAVRDAGGYLEDLEYDFSLSPGAPVLAAGVFLLAKLVPWSTLAGQGWWPASLISLFSVTSFTVYLSHPMVMETLEGRMLGWGFDAATFHPAFAIPAETALVFLICVTLGMFIVSLRRLAVHACRFAMMKRPKTAAL
ncbi:MAG: acyltransferase family protein [Planctomycetota bacterium]